MFKLFLTHEINSQTNKTSYCKKYDCESSYLLNHSFIRQKEEELRNSLDPKYAHLSDELHVEISALAPPAEAHARIAYALAEVKKYLIPDASDMMRQTQMREIMERGRYRVCLEVSKTIVNYF